MKNENRHTSFFKKYRNRKGLSVKKSISRYHSRYHIRIKIFSTKNNCCSKQDTKEERDSFDTRY